MSTKSLLNFFDKYLMGALAVLSVVWLVVMYSDFLRYVFVLWGSSIDSEGKHFFVHYHGFVFAPLAILLILRNMSKNSMQCNGNFIGVLFLLFGLFGGLFGALSSIYYVANIGFVLAVTGLCIAYWGADWLRLNWLPLLLLIILVPMPQFILIRIYAFLTSVVSKVAVKVAHLIGLSVFIDGNVVEIGELSQTTLAVADTISFLLIFVATSIFLLNFTSKKLHVY